VLKDNIHYANLGDTRPELECFLAHHHLSLHADSNLHVCLKEAQVGLDRRAVAAGAEGQGLLEDAHLFAPQSHLLGGEHHL